MDESQLDEAVACLMAALLLGGDRHACHDRAHQTWMRAMADRKDGDPIVPPVTDAEGAALLASDLRDHVRRVLKVGG